ncbi:VPS10 domain-containing receptor SorCS1 isoform 1 [Anopheles sinensis]|uniref:VPS10 domain-containing receptor SorCS1 isoform 1 n=1 Tax=Anopheles sinensis TaxID=74873 RepID=A0A084WAG4_ANOSI|nr:VPS10 domain-containing receptor SorCS1 isoform 1 [Anopheles sinensis]
MEHQLHPPEAVVYHPDRGPRRSFTPKSRQPLGKPLFLGQAIFLPKGCWTGNFGATSKRKPRMRAKSARCDTEKAATTDGDETLQ